jgi:outer membrane murein-binding lipoprotein Lpp
MKIKMIICSVLTTALLTGCININYGCHEGHGKKGEKGEAKDKEASQAELMAQAKISKDTAQQTALAKVPNGTIKEGEIEKENGKLQWSFDVATPGSTDITEVNVDAMTGDVISMDKESAADEAKEAAEDAAKAKKGGKEEKD